MELSWSKVRMSGAHVHVVVKASLRTRLMYIVVVKARVVMSIFPCRFQSSQQAPSTCIERRD